MGDHDALSAADITAAQRQRLIATALAALDRLDGPTLSVLDDGGLFAALWPGWRLLHHPSPARAWFLAQRDDRWWLAFRHPSSAHAHRGAADPATRWRLSSAPVRREAVRAALSVVVVEPDLTALLSALTSRTGAAGGAARTRVEVAAIEAALTLPHPDAQAVRLLVALGGVPEIARLLRHPI